MQALLSAPRRRSATGPFAASSPASDRTSWSAERPLACRGRPRGRRGHRRERCRCRPLARGGPGPAAGRAPGAPNGRAASQAVRAAAGHRPAPPSSGGTGARDYLREEAPDGAAVHRRLEEIAAKHGWTLPNLKAFMRRTQRDFTREEIVRARQGALAVMDLVPHRERTVEGLEPLSIVNGDGREFDVVVRVPCGPRRPAGGLDLAGRADAKRSSPGPSARPRARTWSAPACTGSSWNTACPARCWSTARGPPPPSG